MKKIIVAHPGRQHSFRLAAALKNEKVLFKYVTTVYNKESSIIMKFAKKFLKKDNLKRANNRRCEALKDEDVIQFCELRGFFELILVRIDKRKFIYKWFNKRTANVFGRKVAKYAIKNNVDAVIMYDNTAQTCFEILKKRAPHIKRIMDSSIASQIYQKDIFEKEFESTGDESYKFENIQLWNHKYMSKIKKEIHDTQYFLVPSKFVSDSFVFSGVDRNKINIIPYGINFCSNNIIKNKKNYNNINFLFVGQVIARKGVKYLLDAFSSIDNKDITLTIVGEIGINFKEKIAKEQLKNINFVGCVTHDKMKLIFEKADVFVFPSLIEGMTLAGLEAMACGLPIICTPNTGINDIVIEGENGFVIPCSNSEAIKEKIEWFLNNREKIEIMSLKAKKVALNYTWENYDKKITQTIKNIVYKDLL